MSSLQADKQNIWWYNLNDLHLKIDKQAAKLI